MRVRGPDNVGRAVQTDPSAITEQKNCWELLAQKFQHSIGCAKGRNMYHPTMLRPFARGLK